MHKSLTLNAFLRTLERTNEHLKENFSNLRTRFDVKGWKGKERKGKERKEQALTFQVTLQVTSFHVETCSLCFLSQSI